MQPIILNNPAELPDRPFHFYYATSPDEAQDEYRAKYGKEPKAVYCIIYPEPRTDSYILFEEL